MVELLAWSQQVASWRREVHALYADVRAEPDPAAAHARWVERRTALFDSHPAHGPPARPGPPPRGVRPGVPVRAGVQPAEPDEWRPTTGATARCPSARAGRFEIPDSAALDVWWLGSYGNGIFVPLRDATAGSTTYGAGRYLLDTVKGADLGREGDCLGARPQLLLQPVLRLRPRLGLPLAPLGNRLAAEVPVGELAPTST